MQEFLLLLRQVKHDESHTLGIQLKVEFNLELLKQEEHALGPEAVQVKHVASQLTQFDP